MRWNDNLLSTRQQELQATLIDSIFMLLLNLSHFQMAFTKVLQMKMSGKSENEICFL